MPIKIQERREGIHTSLSNMVRFELVILKCLCCPHASKGEVHTVISRGSKCRCSSRVDNGEVHTVKIIDCEIDGATHTAPDAKS